MEDGAKTIAVILIGSLILGLLVLVVHPGYRQAAASILRGEAQQSPLWLSNEMYYPDVTLERDSNSDDPT